MVKIVLAKRGIGPRDRNERYAHATKRIIDLVGTMKLGELNDFEKWAYTELGFTRDERGCWRKPESQARKRKRERYKAKRKEVRQKLPQWCHEDSGLIAGMVQQALTH